MTVSDRIEKEADDAHHHRLHARRLPNVLDADPEVRGTRRFLQNPTAHLPEKAGADLRERDHRDRTRANSPLVAAPDAVIIDSTHLTLDEVMARSVMVIEEKLKKNYAILLLLFF